MMNVENNDRVFEQVFRWCNYEEKAVSPYTGTKRKVGGEENLMLFILKMQKLALVSEGSVSYGPTSLERCALITFNYNVLLSEHGGHSVEVRTMDSQEVCHDQKMGGFTPFQERCEHSQEVCRDEVGIFNSFTDWCEDSQEVCQGEAMDIITPFEERCQYLPGICENEAMGVRNFEQACENSQEACQDEEMGTIPPCRYVAMGLISLYKERCEDPQDACREGDTSQNFNFEERGSGSREVCGDEENVLVTLKERCQNVCQGSFIKSVEEINVASSCCRDCPKRLECATRNLIEVEEKDADKEKEGRDRQNEQSNANKHAKKERAEAIGNKGDVNAAGETDNVGEEKRDKEGGEGDKDKDKEGEDNLDSDEEEGEEEGEEEEEGEGDGEGEGEEKKGEEEGISDMHSAVCTSSVPSLGHIQDSRRFLTYDMFYDEEFSNSELALSCSYQYSRRYSRRRRDVNQEADSGCKMQITDKGISNSHIQSTVIDPHGQTSSDTSKDCHTDASIHCNKGQTSYCGSPCLHSLTDESFQASLDLSRRPSGEVNASHNDMLKLHDSPSYQTSSDASKDFSCVSPKHPPQPSGIKLKIKLPREEMLQINNVNDGTNEEVISNHNEEKTMKQLPTTAKALLSSGLLEGSRVYYQYRGNEIFLTGVVKGGGILCNCKLCGGRNIVNVSSFERHAGSNARHPSDYIFLENGKSLQDVLRNGRNNNQGNCIGKVRKACYDTEGDTNSRRQRTTVSAFRKKSPSSNAGLLNLKNEADSTTIVHTPQSSQARDGSRHKMLFLPGGLPDGTEVSYYVKGQCYLTGIKMGHGICCGCCNEVISCSQFEAHAGWASRRNAYISMFLSNGQSLHEYALTLSAKDQNTREINASRDRNDYCAECGDSGVLIGCNTCPRAYHAECAGISSILGDALCCSICESERNQTSKVIRGCGRPISLLMREKLSLRCQRVVKASQNTLGGCVFCKNGDFLKSGFGAKTIMLCDQCEREYHVGCMKEQGIADLQELPPGEWFCCAECKNIHDILEGLVSRGSELVEVDILNVIAKKRYQNEASYEQVIPQCQDFSWQLLHGRRGDPNNGKTLSEVAKIFSESFDPIIDATSRRDLISLMVYSQSTRDQDFRGMYCAVLRWKEEVVSAAVIRVFGKKFAEMPLVATSETNRGQGYFQILMLRIEGLLRSLQVKYLVLPAAEEAVGIWINKFAFSKLQDAQLQQFGSEVQMMIFQGSSMLFKPI